VKTFARLASWKLGERHIVGDAGVVDEHGQFFTCVLGGDRVDAGISAEVRYQWMNLNIRKHGNELFESIAATPYDNQVVPINAEPSSKRPTDAGGCPR
jgi:hypothetical protein